MNLTHTERRQYAKAFRDAVEHVDATYYACHAIHFAERGEVNLFSDTPAMKWFCKLFQVDYSLGFGTFDSAYSHWSPGEHHVRLPEIRRLALCLAATLVSDPNFHL